MSGALLNRPRKAKRPSSVLGLTLDGSRLEGAVLRRTNGSLQVVQTFSATLSLDPLTAAPDLVGSEIRNHLQAAGVRERACVLGLPVKWVLTTGAEIPDLPEADVASFLQIEAERGFPCDAATLHICSSRVNLAGGKQQALLAGIPRNHLAAMGQALHAAKLRPASFTLATPAPAHTDGGVLALFIGETGIGLQLLSAGETAVLRWLEGTVEVDAGQRRLSAEIVARETRITLGQLPEALRGSLRRLRVFGPRDLAQQLADELDLRLESMKLEIEVAGKYAAADFGLELPPDTPVTAAVTIAASALAEKDSPFEFLPPRVTLWQQVNARVGTGKARNAGAIAALAALVVVALFLWQQWQLVTLQARWRGMSASVRELEEVQQRIRQYRPWFDDSVRGLSILRQLTVAFPEDGVVTAKTVEIRDGRLVTCTGTSGDNPSLLKTLDRLRESSSVTDLEVGQIRGKSPSQFTFGFRWNDGGSGER